MLYRKEILENNGRKKAIDHKNEPILYSAKSIAQILTAFVVKQNIFRARRKWVGSFRE